MFEVNTTTNKTSIFNTCLNLIAKHDMLFMMCLLTAALVFIFFWVIPKGLEIDEAYEAAKEQQYWDMRDGIDNDQKETREM